MNALHFANGSVLQFAGDGQPYVSLTMKPAPPTFYVITGHLLAIGPYDTRETADARAAALRASYPAETIVVTRTMETV